MAAKRGTPKGTKTAPKSRGRGKGTPAAGGKKAAKPAPSSTRSRAKTPRKTEVKLTPLDRVHRAKRIAARRAKKHPDTWVQIAVDEGLSERQARRVYDDYLVWQKPDRGPDELVDETLALIEAGMLELDDVIAASAKDGNHAARVGAIRLLFDAVAARWDVMQRSGRLPASFAQWRAGQESQVIFEAMARVLRRHNIGQEVIDELLSAIAGEEPAALGGGDDVVEGTVAA